MTSKRREQFLFAIHRHWIWAIRIRHEYYERLKSNPPQNDDLLEWFLTGEAMYLCMWYGLLFTVCEGLREGRFAGHGVEPEINSIYSDLRLFRNAIFHIQKDYFTPKMFSFLQNAKSEATVRRIYEKLDDWFSAQFSKESDSPAKRIRSGRARPIEGRRKS
jgi:hypothetical protein